MAVYDWNLYAAAYAVSQGRRHGSRAVSSETELALLAVLAERRWDTVAPSVRAVEDALRVSPSPLARTLLSANDLSEVVNLVRDSVAPNTAGRWLRVFTGEVPVEEVVESLAGPPIEGWIAANVLRRGPLDESTRTAVLGALHATNRTIRWRAAHTLGADDSAAAIDGLLEVVDGDDWQWARYGAVRALVEVAAKRDTQRDRVLEELRARLPALQEDQRVFAELLRALELRDPPNGWVTDVAPLVEDMFIRARTVEDQDHWRQVGWRIADAVRRARRTESV
jgi:hypothetical protein